jgi:hypothetical protein
MSKKINQLTAATDEEALNDSYLFAIADPTDGIALKMTVEQAKEVFGTKKLKYVASGEEGLTITIAQLAGKDILSILRSSGPLYEGEGVSPDYDEYKWDSVTIFFGVATNPGEKFLILYRNF